MDEPARDSAPRRRTVLVVDDDPGTRHVMASGIGDVLGTFDVVTAENGRAATEILENQRIDAIATDLSMPVMDGFALIAYVSNRKEALPVVAFSGLATSEVEEQLSSYGGLRILRKPVSYQKIAATLEEAIAQVEQGQVEGIPLVSLLQLVQLERRTCTVVVACERRKGRLHFQSGQLINAFSDDFGADGEAAARDILGWHDHTSLSFESLPHGVRPDIRTPLQKMMLGVATPRGVDARRDAVTPRQVDAPQEVDAPRDPPSLNGVSSPAEPEPDTHVTALLAAVSRLTNRVRDADDALVTVTEEIDVLRRAHREYEAVNEERERRRLELEAFRDEVSDLARALVDRVDAILGSASTTHASTSGDDASPPSPS